MAWAGTCTVSVGFQVQELLPKVLLAEKAVRAGSSGPGVPGVKVADPVSAVAGPEL